MIEEFLRRLANSPYGGEFVLRGGVLTRLWVGEARRATRDLDFLGLFPRDLDEVARRLADLFSMESLTGVTFGLETLRGEVIWQETAFPGLRFRVESQKRERLQIDIGFNDPLVPPAEWISIHNARVLAAPPELLAAWKLDGLFEHGVKRWLPKDLFDLHLLTTHCQLNDATLAESVRVAFAAHGHSLSDTARIVNSADWWHSELARTKWAKFRAASEVPVPQDVADVAASVARALRPALELIA